MTVDVERDVERAWRLIHPTCPCCGGSDRTPLWWSKAGLTYLLCEEHKAAARSERRLRREFQRVRDQTFTLVRMDDLLMRLPRLPQLLAGTVEFVAEGEGGNPKWPIIAPHVVRHQLPHPLHVHRHRRGSHRSCRGRGDFRRRYGRHGGALRTSEKPADQGKWPVSGSWCFAQGARRRSGCVSRMFEPITQSDLQRFIAVHGLNLEPMITSHSLAAHIFPLIAAAQKEAKRVTRACADQLAANLAALADKTEEVARLRTALDSAPAAEAYRQADALRAALTPDPKEPA